MKTIIDDHMETDPGTKQVEEHWAKKGTHTHENETQKVGADTSLQGIDMNSSITIHTEWEPAWADQWLTVDSASHSKDLRQGVQALILVLLIAMNGHRKVRIFITPLMTTSNTSN